MKMYFIRLFHQHVRTVKKQLESAGALSIIEASILGATLVYDHREQKDEPTGEHTLLIASFHETTERLQGVIDACTLSGLIASVRIYQIQEGELRA